MDGSPFAEKFDLSAIPAAVNIFTMYHKGDDDRAVPGRQRRFHPPGRDEYPGRAASPKAGSLWDPQPEGGASTGCRAAICSGSSRVGRGNASPRRCGR